jgi:hypothetical protein
MARKQVVEVHCSRCSRVEHREGVQEKPAHVLLAKLYGDPPEGDVVVQFEDLCSPCLRTVKALLGQMAKQIEGISPDRGSGKRPAAKKEAKERGVANGSSPQPNHPVASSTAAVASVKSSVASARS